MKFQPTAHMGGNNLLEPCCELGTANATQIYQNINGVQWQMNLYTSSIAKGGATGSSDTHQVPITGSTNHAIVVCVGGGGSAYSTQTGGFGGGGGGMIVSSSITLKSGSIYSVTIGNGGDGFSCVPAGGACNPNGQDGNPSSFVGGGYNIAAGGGKGSTLADGSGGSSGFPNIQSGSEDGGCGVAFAATGSGGSNGLSFHLGQNAPIIAAGGGGSKLNDASGEAFGGNSSRDTREGGDEYWTFGGGSRGKLEFHSPTSQYFSTPALSGCVLVAVPMNLCSSSLYAKTDYVKADLLNYWDFNNGRTFGKSPFNTRLQDIRTPSNFLETESQFLGFASSSATLLTNNYLFGRPPIKYETSTPTAVDVFENLRFSASLANTTAAFSYEWYGEPTGSSETLFFVNEAGTTNPLSQPRFQLTETFGGRFDYVDGSGAETQLLGSITSNTDNHVVVTYDGSELKLYVNAVEAASATVSITGSLDNPLLYLGDAPPAGGNSFHKVFRVYNDKLTSDEVMQNYSASAGL